MQPLTYITVKEARTTPFVGATRPNEMIVPPDYADVIPEECVCKADMLISLSRRKMKCSSPHCYIKLAWRMTKLYSAFEIKGYAIETFKEIARGSNAKSMQDMLAAPPVGTGVLLDEKLKIPRTWAESIKLLGLPLLKDTALKVFGGCTNMEQWVQTAHAAGGVVPLLQQRVGGKVQPLKILEVIRDNQELLCEVEHIFTIRPEAKTQFKFAITGPPTKQLDENGRPIAQLNFAAWVNRQLEPYSMSITPSKAYTEIIILVADQPSSTEKYKEAQARRIPILTSDQVVPFFKELYKAKEQHETHD